MPTMFTAGLAKYDQFSTLATNDCEVSKLRYLPIKVDYQLTVSARCQEMNIPIWIRIDFLKPNELRAFCRAARSVKRSPRTVLTKPSEWASSNSSPTRSVC